MARAPTSAWDFQYCVNMPKKPTYIPNGECTFAAPVAPASIHYLTRKFSARVSTGITMTLRVDQSSDAVWERRPEAGNNGTHPPSVRLYLERRGMRLNLDPRFQYHRLWSCNHWIELKPGVQTITVPFTADNWSGVLGRKDAAGLAATLGRLARVGCTWGGGSFYGHGVRLASGTAQVTIEQFTVA